MNTSNEFEFFDHDVKENVEALLKKYSSTRDDDMKLVATYYLEYYSKLAKEGTAMDFLKAMANSRLVSSDLITRTRRKLQEHNPELRGTKWKERHQRQTDVKSDLKKVDKFRNSI